MEFVDDCYYHEPTDIYPFDLDKIRRFLPHLSLPEFPDAVLLKKYGFHFVMQRDKPKGLAEYVETKPTWTPDGYVQSWIPVEETPERFMRRKRTLVQELRSHTLDLLQKGYVFRQPNTAHNAITLTERGRQSLIEQLVVSPPTLFRLPLADGTLERVSVPDGVVFAQAAMTHYYRVLDVLQTIEDAIDLAESLDELPIDSLQRLKNEVFNLNNGVNQKC